MKGLVVFGVLAICSIALADGYKGLGADSVPAETVAKFAPPPLDHDVSRKIQAMLDVRGPGAGLVTSKGDRMLFAWRVTGTSQIWRQDGPQKMPVQLTGGEDPTTVVGLAPDDSFAVVSRDIGGEENPGIYLLSLDGGALREIQHTKKVRTSLMYVADDSRSLVYRANDIDPASYAMYRYDIATKKKEKLFDTPGLWSIEDHKGDRWLMVKAVGEDHMEVFVYDVATKKLEPVIGQDESEFYDVKFGAGDAVLVRTNKPSDHQRLYRFDKGKLEPVSPDVKADVNAFAIDEARKRIYVQTSQDGYVKTSAFDAASYKPVALPSFAGADNVYVQGLSRDGRFVQLATDGSQQVPNVVVYDWTKNAQVAWRPATVPEVDVKAFAKATLETYPARDGTKIPMFVRRPTKCSADPCAVIVNFHGGPEGQATAGFSPYAQMFVDAGFVFVQPNVRGSLGYGKAWLHADDGPKRLDVITDIEDAAIYIKKAWAKNGKAPKVGVMGGSYGGYSTLMAMTYFAGAYDAGVSEVGISNFATFLKNTAPYRRALRISEYGDPDKDKDALAKLSPLTHIGKLKSPLLVIQGVNDPRVPVNEALQIYKEIEKKKTGGGLILFADEGHGTQKRSNQVLAIGHTIAFFEKQLK